MEMVGSVVAVYGDHNSAEAAVKKLIAPVQPNLFRQICLGHCRFGRIADAPMSKDHEQ
jgi:hypothetical protein